MPAAARADLTYRERLAPPWWMWLWMAVLAVSAGVVSLIALAPAGVLATTVVSLVLGSLLLRAWTGTVEVRGGELRAGPAHVDVSLLGPPAVLDAQRAAAVRGRDINAAAYHYIRGWVPEAVTVELRDPDDPTPYWYVSTRRPRELADAIARAQSAAAS